MVTKRNILNQRTKTDNDTSTLVPANERELGWNWPVAIDSVEIGVTNT